MPLHNIHFLRTDLRRTLSKTFIHPTLRLPWRFDATQILQQRIRCQAPTLTSLRREPCDQSLHAEPTDKVWQGLSLRVETYWTRGSYVDMFSAPDTETATRASLSVRCYENAHFEIGPTLDWPALKKIVQTLPASEAWILRGKNGPAAGQPFEFRLSQD
jgi:hypothetical protein